ncbi:MAG: flagellar hook-associated protein FlgL [Sedimentisphaerales bacterium]|nr:flagellar hook-associated protein FlgL [Sedimentisphaerales bacterium]
MSSAVRPTNTARVSLLMRTDLLMNSIRSNTVDLLTVQNQLSSGLRLGRPSDSPAEATTIMHLDSTIERYGQYLNNLDFADGSLSTTDSALDQAVSLVQEAYTLALESVGMGTDDAGRAANAQMVDQIIEQLISIGNTSYRGAYVFAGQNATVSPFVARNGGVLYTGSLSQMLARVADDNQVNFSMDANETFGTLSSQVVGTADLDPDITLNTLLGDLNGAQNLGVRRGSISISDGTDTTVVDLSSCVTVADVIDKINAEAPGGITASIGADGSSLQLTVAAGNITVREIGTGTTARDLGIYEPTGAGLTLNGQDVDARLTLATPVTALAGGAGIDLLNGLQITNSLVAPVGPLDLSACATMEDVLNVLNGAGLCIRAEINAAADGLNVFNLLSGSRMSIGENGGTTAADLGIRSLTGATRLADCNGGQGVAALNDQGVEGVIRITARDGTTYDVALGTAVTVQDVIDLINAATGGHVTAALTATGNGIELTDTVSGAGNLIVSTISSNDHFVAEELGLAQSVAADTLTGEDINPAMPDGLFSHLQALRDAMYANDDDAISRAAALVDADRQQINTIRGMVGSQVGALDSRRTQMEDNVLALETLRSQIRDVDFTEAITRYQNLYTALQANLMTGNQLTNVSLLDFLS